MDTLNVAAPSAVNTVHTIQGYPNIQIKYLVPRLYGIYEHDWDIHTVGIYEIVSRCATKISNAMHTSMQYIYASARACTWCKFLTQTLWVLVIFYEDGLTSIK